MTMTTSTLNAAMRSSCSQPWKHRRTAAISLMCFSSAMACGGLSSQMEARYSEATGCQDDIDVIEVKSYLAKRYHVRGCGKRTHFYCVQDNCRSPEFEARRRHARDRGCLPNEVSTYDLEDDRFVTEGCGAKATYACEPDHRTGVRCTTEDP